MHYKRKCRKEERKEDVKMSAGEDADKVTQLNNPEVLRTMKNKYGIE